MLKKFTSVNITQENITNLVIAVRICGIEVTGFILKLSSDQSYKRQKILAF